MSKEIIKIRGIKKFYKVGTEEVKALNGVDIVINKNEYVAIMGPSGSGKSTIMNILGCLDSPTDGSYILNDTDVSKMNDGELAEVRNKEI
ncbi:MAG: ATP-binding cassette domain-containing protein, partial [Bacteroidales bacterium]